MFSACFILFSSLRNKLTLEYIGISQNDTPNPTMHTNDQPFLGPMDTHFWSNPGAVSKVRRGTKCIACAAKYGGRCRACAEAQGEVQSAQAGADLAMLWLQEKPLVNQHWLKSLIGKSSINYYKLINRFCSSVMLVYSRVCCDGIVSFPKTWPFESGKFPKKPRSIPIDDSPNDLFQVQNHQNSSASRMKFDRQIQGVKWYEVLLAFTPVVGSWIFCKKQRNSLILLRIPITLKALMLELLVFSL